MIQQYAANNGMMPMMMPMIDPRMMPPVIDPRMVQPMMYNPGIMSTPTSPTMMTPTSPILTSPFVGMVSPSTSTNSYGQQSRPRQQHYRQDSLGSSNGGDKRNHKRTSTTGSLTNSVQSGSFYYAASPTPTNRRTTRKH
jgi:hypothetical protein